MFYHHQQECYVGRGYVSRHIKYAFSHVLAEMAQGLRRDRQAFFSLSILWTFLRSCANHSYQDIGTEYFRHLDYLQTYKNTKLKGSDNTKKPKKFFAMKIYDAIIELVQSGQNGNNHSRYRGEN